MVLGVLRQGWKMTVTRSTPRKTETHPSNIEGLRHPELQLLQPRATATANPRQRVAHPPLEADIQNWEFVAGLFERYLPDFETIDREKVTGAVYAAKLRHGIAEHRNLIDRVKKG
jgi:hypothetical protein